jgi:hypothetical protein
MHNSKKKKVQMPAGIRNKMMAAVSMLLVSSVMLVSTSYAWFTLSTAPEVTGITTSVGANGNLEMALLNTTTFGDLSKITSAVGDSSAQKAVTDANITWGNLVDLDDVSYGLSSINLQPARLNVSAADATKLASVSSILSTPNYGKDGRVAAVSGTTYASGTYSNGTWSYDSESLTYGVRAIGANDNLTAQQAGLLSAKAAYNTALNNAKSVIQTAMSTNGNEMANAIVTLAMGSSAELSDSQVSALNSMVAATSDALTHIDTAYKQVLLAAATSLSSSASYTAAVAAINGAANYSAAITAIQGMGVEVPSALTTAAANLQTQKDNVTQASELLATTASDEVTVETVNANRKAALKLLVDTNKVSVNGYEITDSNGKTDDDLLIYTDSDEGNQTRSINSGFMTKVINDGGVIVEMPDGSGVFAYVGQVAGNYSANCVVTVSYGGVSVDNMNATMKTTATVDSTIGTALKSITASSTGDGTTALSDTYGYVIDFAFRTNASSSYLQLQTDAAQRVYTDSDSTATQGNGSTMTFTAATNDQGVAVLTNDQVKKLMGAIRVGFIDPTDGTIYGIATLDNIASDGDGFTGYLTLKSYSLSSGVLKIGTAVTDDTSTDQDESVSLMALNQSTATKMSVVVWLDGDSVDNGDVANATQSLTGSMNLQFSSSATLQPMQNTSLKNMEITYTEGSANGYFVFNGTTYKLKSGYKFYQGSDNTVYYSTDESSYTKVTAQNVNKIGDAVTASITGDAEIVGTGSVTLTPVLENATITSIVWSSDNQDAATVTGTASSATVTGVAPGSATIKAVITYTGDTSKTIEATYKVTVTAAPTEATEVTEGVS